MASGQTQERVVTTKIGKKTPKPGKQDARAWKNGEPLLAPPSADEPNKAGKDPLETAYDSLEVLQASALQTAALPRSVYTQPDYGKPVTPDIPYSKKKSPHRSNDPDVPHLHVNVTRAQQELFRAESPRTARAHAQAADRNAQRHPMLDSYPSRMSGAPGSRGSTPPAGLHHEPGSGGGYVPVPPSAVGSMGQGLSSVMSNQFGQSIHNSPHANLARRNIRLTGQYETLLHDAEVQGEGNLGALEPEKADAPLKLSQLVEFDLPASFLANEDGVPQPVFKREPAPGPPSGAVTDRPANSPQARKSQQHLPEWGRGGGVQNLTGWFPNLDLIMKNKFALETDTASVDGHSVMRKWYRNLFPHSELASRSDVFELQTWLRSQVLAVTEDLAAVAIKVEHNGGPFFSSPPPSGRPHTSPEGATRAPPSFSSPRTPPRSSGRELVSNSYSLDRTQTGVFASTSPRAASFASRSPKKRTPGSTGRGAAPAGPPEDSRGVFSSIPPRVSRGLEADAGGEAAPQAARKEWVPKEGHHLMQLRFRQAEEETTCVVEVSSDQQVTYIRKMMAAYQVAWRELVRQVGCACLERARLMDSVWTGVRVLFRGALQHSDMVAQRLLPLKHQLEQMREDYQSVDDRIARLNDKIAAQDYDSQALRREREVLSREVVKLQSMLDATLDGHNVAKKKNVDEELEAHWKQQMQDQLNEVTAQRDRLQKLNDKQQDQIVMLQDHVGELEDAVPKQLQRERVKRRAESGIGAMLAPLTAAGLTEEQEAIMQEERDAYAAALADRDRVIAELQDQVEKLPELERALKKNMMAHAAGIMVAKREGRKNKHKKAEEFSWDSFLDKIKNMREGDPFMPLGDHKTVPSFLKTKANSTTMVRNRNMIKRDTEKMAKACWAAKSKHDSERRHKGQPPLDMIAFTQLFLNREYGLSSMVTEMGYNFIYSLQRYDSDIDCKLILMILIGEVHEEVYWDQVNLQTDLRYLCEMLDEKLNYGNRTGKLPVSDLTVAIKEYFYFKTEAEMAELWAALDQDFDDRGWKDKEGKMPKMVPSYKELLSEDKNCDQGPFVETVRSQHLRMRMQYFIDLESILTVSLEDQPVDLEMACSALKSVDPMISLNQLKEYVSRGFGQYYEDLLKSRESDGIGITVDRDEFMQNIKNGVVARNSSRDETSLKTGKALARAGRKKSKPPPRARRETFFNVFTTVNEKWAEENAKQNVDDNKAKKKKGKTTTKIDLKNILQQVEAQEQLVGRSEAEERRHAPPPAAAHAFRGGGASTGPVAGIEGNIETADYSSDEDI